MRTNGEPRDPGLARERTVLAGNRSGLALVVCAAVVPRHVWPLKGATELVTLGIIAAIAVAGALALLVLRINRHEHASRSSHRERAFGLMTVGAVVLALLAIALTFATSG